MKQLSILHKESFRRGFFMATLLLLSLNGWSDNHLTAIQSKSDLHFNKPAVTWDEGIPLGNATVGELVWQKGEALRFSLDRTDLWDLRLLDSLKGPNFRFAWIKEQVSKGNYKAIQKKFDLPYEDEAAPSKIPGAAIEFTLANANEANSVHLFLHNALCEVKWPNGTTLKTFVHATQNVGWFEFNNLKGDIKLRLKAPQYQKDGSAESHNSVDGQSLTRLGYEQGSIQEKPGQITYHQKGYNGFFYDVSVRWIQKGQRLYGVWSITTSLSSDKAGAETSEALKRGIDKDYQTHTAFWNSFWAASSVNIPDPVLQKQYDNEMYKFGSAAREHSYPISLQAVWTADNGNLPPWKGDYHHDLNTQLSYWPSYTGNHLQEELGYLNTLWSQRDVYKKYTRQFFEADGMDIPGVCTLTGEPMGGWVQYSMSQTVSAWLSQHFYLHWKYSMDRTFLKERAYPFIKDVAIFLEQMTKVNNDGIRTLTISTSPEIFDNSAKAWFKTITNYDLSLIRFVFGAASELAGELKLSDEASHWSTLKAQLPSFDLDAEGALTFAKGFPYDQSHRHFSHAMSIYPLSLIDWSQGEKSQNIIRATLKKLGDNGPDYWTGYSYSWFGIMKARAFDGEGAARELRTFAECFCLPNTFHANGDQTKSGKSKFIYRPFTLEGNFAFAAGIQEMLMQSHTGIIRLFPSIPKEWKDASFNKLRAMGAFIVSAEMKDGKVKHITINPEQGGVLKIAIPEGSSIASIKGNEGEKQFKDGILTLNTIKGRAVIIEM